MSEIYPGEQFDEARKKYEAERKKHDKRWSIVLFVGLGVAIGVPVFWHFVIK